MNAPSQVRSGKQIFTLVTAGVAPMYKLEPSGVAASPTGRAFVRFSDHARAHEADISAAGFEVIEIPGYAPQAAWVRARSGEIADCLAQLDRLKALAGVESVQPEMLMQAPRK